MRAITRRGAGAMGALFLLAASARAQAPRDLLPDIVVRASDLADRDVVDDLEPGRLHLRFSNGTANVGEGALELFGQAPGTDDDTQSVLQRVQRDDGSWYDREAGVFVYHPEHSHIHIEDWARYRLRRQLPADGVGEIVAESEKVSFCILDLSAFDAELPGFSRTPRFNSCASIVQGLSVGWVDVYSKHLPGQNIDITDIPDGFYWLESEVDPLDHVLESNESNNVTRVKLTIGNPSQAPDRFEPNDEPLDVAVLPAGAPNSPNLGPTNPERVISGLSLHHAGDEDYFRFYSNSTGTGDSYVSITFDPADGDLDLTLLNDELQEIAASNGTEGLEMVSLDGLPEGWLFARVRGGAEAVNPEYQLRVVPPANQPPSVVVLQPGADGVDLIHGSAIFAVTWEAFDPEDDEAWVSVFLNAQPALDGNQRLVPTTLFTDAALELASINSAEIAPGTYWVYCEITDGGSSRGAWSAGTVAFHDFEPACATSVGGPDDCNGNSIKDDCELAANLASDCDRNGVPDACDLVSGTLPDADGSGVPDPCEQLRFHRGDGNGDGDVDIADASSVLNFLFTGGPPPGCLEAADAGNDGEVDISDGIQILDFLFGGGPPPAIPGAPPAPCGYDPDPRGSARDLGCDTYPPCA